MDTKLIGKFYQKKKTNRKLCDHKSTAKNNNNENHHAMISYIYNELRDIAYLLKISNSEWNLYLIFDNYELGFVCFFFFWYKYLK